MATPKSLKEQQLASLQWERYLYGLTRGHSDYQKQAKTNENFYLGAGRQWSEEAKQALEEQGKPWLEENIIFPTINTILGTQTQSRMDIAYKPRDVSDQETADTLTKIAMYTVDKNRFPWKESTVFADGIIQQRGFFEVKMDFEKNFFGDISIKTLDPLDVIPDPDAKEYSPEEWKDVIVIRWLTLDDIKELYGTAKYRKVMQEVQGQGDADFSTSAQYNQFDSEIRNSFGDFSSTTAFFTDRSQITHIRIIDRQYYKLQMRGYFFDPDTGDAEPVPDSMTKTEAKRVAKRTGKEYTERLSKRVRWTVSTSNVILHDEWSPYDSFTIIPYFPYFRRGKTLSVVDNLIKTQEMINKTFSQILHTVNTTANSGWIVDEDSLVNMEVEDLEEEGASTGLVLEVKQGRTRPQKIEANTVPTGLKDVLSTSMDLMRVISGVSESFTGNRSNEVSGVAIQSRIQQAAVQLAGPIDNLFKTRNMIGEKILKLIQQFYTEERVFLITAESVQDQDERVVINQIEENGEVLNDVTKGNYDIVIADVPTQITFQNAQFAQAIEMRKFGVQIPDEEMIMMSTLSRKQEISKKIDPPPSEEDIAAQKESAELELEKTRQEIEKLKYEAEAKENAATKLLAEVAAMIKENPGIGQIMDSLSEQEEQEEPAEGLEPVVEAPSGEAPLPPEEDGAPIPQTQGPIQFPDDLLG